MVGSSGHSLGLMVVDTGVASGPSATAQIPQEIVSRATYRPFGALRLMLALLVVLSHARELGGDAISKPLAPWGVGSVGVMAFFVLSGFVISEAMGTYYRGRVGAFIVNRVLRLWPPYVWALALSIALHALLSLGRPDAFAPLNVVIQPFLPVFPAPPAWSYPFVRYLWAIQIEFWFYLFFAAAVWAACRFTPQTLMVSAAFVGAICVAIGAAWLGRRTLLVFALSPYFLLGLCIYHIVSDRGLLPLAGAAVASAYVAWHFWRYTGQPLSVVALACIIVGIAALAFGRLATPLKAVDQWLGDLSYPVYLNHFAILLTFPVLWPARGLTAFMAFVFITIATSWLAHLCVEPLTRGIRDRLRGAAL